MPITVTKPAINLREELARAKAKPRGATLLPQIVEEGDGSKTRWSLPAGMKPYAVFNGGALSTEGDLNDYAVEFDGFVHTVVFAVAPANGNPVSIWPTEA